MAGHPRATAPRPCAPGAEPAAREQASCGQEARASILIVQHRSQREAGGGRVPNGKPPLETLPTPPQTSYQREILSGTPTWGQTVVRCLAALAYRKLACEPARADARFPSSLHQRRCTAASITATRMRFVSRSPRISHPRAVWPSGQPRGDRERHRCTRTRPQSRHPAHRSSTRKASRHPQSGLVGQKGCRPCSTHVILGKSGQCCCVSPENGSHRPLALAWSASTTQTSNHNWHGAR